MWIKFKEEKPKFDRFLILEKESTEIIIAEKCIFWEKIAYRNDHGNRIYEEDIEWWHPLPKLPKQSHNQANAPEPPA